MATFLLRLDPPRPTFPFDATEAGKALFSEHAAYRIARAGEGRAIAVAPVFDHGGTWGPALVETDDEAAAMALGAADPVVRAEAGFRYAVAPVPSPILRHHEGRSIHP